MISATKTAVIHVSATIRCRVARRRRPCSSHTPCIAACNAVIILFLARRMNLTNRADSGHNRYSLEFFSQNRGRARSPAETKDEGPKLRYPHISRRSHCCSLSSSSATAFPGVKQSRPFAICSCSNLALSAHVQQSAEHEQQLYHRNRR